MDELRRCTGFHWDDGNSEKNRIAHRVTRSECEQVFFGQPIVIARTGGQQRDESRYYALGRTEMSRRLFIVFTVRGANVRVISARDMSRRERRAYQSAQEETGTQI